MIPFLVCLSPPLMGQDVAADQVRTAVTAALPWLEKGSAGSSQQNQCFTCHNHALPVLALAEAKRSGFPIDERNLTAQLDHTLVSLRRGEQQYREGDGQGGGVLTAGYALWTLAAGQIGQNETTSAVADYVLQHQSDSDHWTKSGQRPPADGSEFTATFVALRSLRDFGSAGSRAVKEGRFVAAEAWLVNTPPVDTEDAVFRIKALRIVTADDDVMATAIDELLKQQKADGGWAQTDDMVSDAYATGTVVATLLQEGRLSTEHSAVQNGLRFLVDTQCDAGTWRVKTRAEAFQLYYESGFPYEKDQFISITASSWATIALLRSLPELNSGRNQ